MNALLRRPLARWGFTTLAVVALFTAQTGPCLVCTVLAVYAWRCAPTRRR